MYNDIVRTKNLMQREWNWHGLKNWLAHSVRSTNPLSQKKTTESGFASKDFPAEKKQQLSFQFGSGDGRF